MPLLKPHPFRRTFIYFLIWSVLAAAAFLVDGQNFLNPLSDKSALTALGLAGLIGSVQSPLL